MDLFDIRNQLNSGKSIFDIPLRVTYYARVSSDKDEQLHSLSAQVAYYSEFIENNPNWTYINGYIDEGLSGTSVTKREAFLRMMEDAKRNKFDFIITKEISRFSRNTIDSIKYTQDLLSNGVGVLFQSDNINTLFADSELRLTIMSSIAQDEVRRISERVRFGFKRSIENGVVLGNSRIWGYRKDKGKLVIVEKEAEIVRKIFDFYANENLGLRTISRRLYAQGITNNNGNEFSCSALKNIILNPKYKGYYCGNKTHKYDYRRSDKKQLSSSEWVMYKDYDTVPPIVTEEIWDKANAVLRKRSEKMISGDRTSYQNKYPYSGKILCTIHETPYHHCEYRSKNGNRDVWRCKHAKDSGRGGCDNPTIYTSEIDDIMRHIMVVVFKGRKQIVNDLIEVYSFICKNSTNKIEIAKLNTKIAEIHKKKNRLLDLNIDEKISDSEFESRNNGFNAEIEAFQKQITDYQDSEEFNKDILVKMQNLRKIITKKLSFEEAMDTGVINSLLDRIEVVSGGKNSINLKIILKVSDDDFDYEITRSKGGASVITAVCDTPT
ncbi:MAG: recombinase family protein [Oscillospiraceae bacterium]|nr:recombinase family protein [Oscillospiraceae bacterium]